MLTCQGGDKYKNLFFRLTIDAPHAKFEIAPLVNTSEKRARLVQILADSVKFDERYTFGVLADTLSMYPQLQSAAHYVRSVRHQLEKEGLTTVHEEFPVLVSGVPFRQPRWRDRRQRGASMSRAPAK